MPGGAVASEGMVGWSLQAVAHAISKAAVPRRFIGVLLQLRMLEGHSSEAREDGKTDVDE